MPFRQALGEILIEMNLCSRQAIERALTEQAQARLGVSSPVPETMPRSRLVSEARLAGGAQSETQLGRLLVRMGAVTKEQLDQALSRQAEVFEEFANLDSKKLACVLQLCIVVNSTLNLASVLQLIMGMSNQVTNSEASTLMLLDDQTGELVFSVPTGPKSRALKDVRLPRGAGVAGWVAEHGVPLLVPDVRQDPRFFPDMDQRTGFVTKSILAVPLQAKARLIGVLEVINKRGGSSFTVQDRLYLDIFGSHAALAIENARMYRELEERAKSDLAMHQQLAHTDKLRALGLLASGIAHNFNNILTVIQGNAEMLARPQPREELARRLEVIQEAVRGGAEIVKRVLKFAKGKEQTEPQGLVDLNKVVEDSLSITEPLWRAKLQQEGVTIQVGTHLPPGEVLVNGQAEDLKEVLVNLIFNAVDAMPQGGRLEVSTAVGEQGVVLRVSDTGQGMSEEERGKVFDPFFTTKGVTHAGLGMSMVHSIISGHGGVIDVSSRPGKGTTFLLSFPPGRAIGPHPERQPRQTQAPPADIMVIDDEEQVAAFVAETLTLRGHRVRVFTDPRSGLAALAGSRCQLLITDLAMPHMSGWEVLRMARVEMPGLKTGLITGWEVEGAQGDEAKASFIIQKPFSMRELAQRVDQALLEA